MGKRVNEDIGVVLSRRDFVFSVICYCILPVSPYIYELDCFKVWFAIFRWRGEITC